jgi:sec-independent protein translocase protein TatA
VPDIGAPEILIILLIAALLFGAKKIPELARSVGRASSEFKKGIKEGAAEQEAPPAEPAQPAEPADTPGASS